MGRCRRPALAWISRPALIGPICWRCRCQPRPARQGEARRRGLRVDATLGAAPATGDRRLAESLVANLVDNALRHNVADGRVEVVTRADGGQAVISVRNTGQPVSAGEVDRLFQPFQRLGSERIRHAGGRGLGLAIVRAIADAHGATLTARARPEGGLDVEVSFPDRPGLALPVPSCASSQCWA